MSKIDVMISDYSKVLKEAKAMGCRDIRALYNVPLDNMAIIIKALEGCLELKPTTTIHTKMVKGQTIAYPKFHCSNCGKRVFSTHNYCSLCGQGIDWSDY